MCGRKSGQLVALSRRWMAPGGSGWGDNAGPGTQRLPPADLFVPVDDQSGAQAERVAWLQAQSGQDFSATSGGADMSKLPSAQMADGGLGVAGGFGASGLSAGGGLGLSSLGGGYRSGRRQSGVLRLL